MADERIEVEWIATANRMVQVLDRLENKFDKQEKQLEDIARTSKKTAEAAAGSFNAIEQELKQAEAAMKGMTQGTQQFAAQKAKVDALRDSLKSAKGQMQQAGGGFADTLRGGVDSVKNMVAGMVTIQGLVQALTSEFQKMQQIRIGTAETTKTFEQAISAMAMNLGEATPQARQMILEAAPTLGASPAQLAEMFSSAISLGAKDLDEALAVSAMSLKMTAGDVTKAQPIMSGMLALASTTGERNFEALFGQLRQFQEAASGTDLAQSINNMTAAFSAANTKGQRIQALGSEQTLEMASVISQILVDPTMANTGTAMRQMVTKMDAFIAQRQMTLDDKTVSRLTQEQVDSFNKLDTVAKRIEAMRQTPELGKQFLSSIEEGVSKTAIRVMVQGDQKALELEQRARQTVTGAPGGKEEFNRLTKIIEEASMLTRAENVSRAQRETAMIRDPIAAMEGQIIQEVKKTTEEINLSGFDLLRKMDIEGALAEAESRQRPIGEAAVNLLEQFKQQTKMLGFIPVGGQVTSADQKRLQDGIDRISILMEKQTQLQQQMLQQQQQPQPPVKVQATPMRPKEAPLPAATAP